MMRTALAALVLAAASAAPAAAQPRGSVRGVVRTATGERIPYVLVALEPRYPRRLTDDSGVFVFSEVGPGTYDLRARQVGYKPLDTTVVVTGDSTIHVAVALERLVIQLAAINVTAERNGRPARCTAPGPPDPRTSPYLAAIFDQLTQNAERYWTLADSYPVLYRMSRLFSGWAIGQARPDTLILRTDARWHYEPGKLLEEWAGPRGGTDVQVNLPTLPDFADTAFHRTHCFTLAGLDTLDDGTYVRIDFRAAARLAEPDADGSAYLDPNSYVIRHARVKLTRPESALLGLSELEAHIDYAEIAPLLVIVEHITSDRIMHQGQFVYGRREEQGLLDVHFIRPLPGHQVSAK